MNQFEEIQQELKEMSSSLVAAVGSGYTVPAGYFEGLAESVLSRIRSVNAAEETALLSPFLSSLSKSMPYSVPENYFEIAPSIEHGARIISIDAGHSFPDPVPTGLS